MKKSKPKGDAISTKKAKPPKKQTIAQRVEGLEAVVRALVAKVGIAGPQGEPGEKGAKGDTGAKGEKGGGFFG